MVCTKHVSIYTDGSCRCNPGPGGWGAILVYGEKELELSGGAPSTTNNRMELSGVIEALKKLKEPCEVTLTTDSKYVCDSVMKGWVFSWKSKGWLRGKNEEVPNADLWQALVALLEKHNVTFTWVKGHAGHPYNERCDKLATGESGKFI